MVWKIHFTPADLTQVQISPTLGPLAETVLAVSFLRCPVQSRTLFGDWCDQVRGRLTADARRLVELVPPGSRGVDLYTLIGEASTIDHAVDALLALPGDQVLAELVDVDRRRRLPDSAWAVAEPGSPARSQLAAASVAAYRTLIEPYWAGLYAQMHAEQAARSRILSLGGAERLLITLQNRRIRWRPPVLEIGTAGWVGCDLHLNGRGLALVPSVFVGSCPSLNLNLADPGEAPRLMLPLADVLADPCSLLSSARPGGPGALSALIGRTRATALSSIADGCTTTELAARVGVSVAAASQHATVLREAGLIRTRRHGSAVLHTLAPLGIELLQAGSGAVHRAVPC